MSSKLSGRQISSQVVWKANVVQVVWKANAKCRPSCLEGKCQMLSKLSGRQMSSKFSGRQMSSKWSGRQMLSSSLEVFATFLLYFYIFSYEHSRDEDCGAQCESLEALSICEACIPNWYSGPANTILSTSSICYEKYLVWQCFTFRQGYPYWFIFVHV